MSISDNMKKFGMMMAYNYLDKDPDKNIPKLLDWIDKFDRGGEFEKQRGAFREAIRNPENNWYQLMRSLWTDIDDGVRKTLFKNFIINATLIGYAKQQQYRDKYHCNIPWAILMDPTSACNLHCTGCWAADYGNKLNMSFDTLDNIIEQGKEMGIYMYIYSGGEPLMHKEDIIALCNKHYDCEFLSFTNGTFIDEDFADEMLRVKNFVPAISVEGFETATDSRRGNGTFAKVKRAMEILKSKKLPFGISSCYTRKNVDTIGSEEYFDQMVQWGAKFCWLFTYMPIGKKAVPELMVTAEQREFMYHQVRKFRQTKPLFTMDFWNDGEYVDGCIAGGRRYLHINANGDIEPCAFIHYSDSNIYQNTLLEAFQSPLFTAYHNNQPFNNNHLRPCPLLDNPGRITEMVEQSGARCTNLESPEDVRKLSNKCALTAEHWAETADRLWSCSHGCGGCEMLEYRLTNANS
jgi:MoaA/NifB/PqqE/SkfB family radical SAM enzyme